MSGTIVLRNRQAVHGSTGCNDIPIDLAPQWDYVAPTPDMEAKGLTPTVLRQIVDGINERSQADFRENYPDVKQKKCLRMCQLAVVLLGAFIMLDSYTTQLFSAPNCWTNSFGGEYCQPSAGFWVGVTFVGIGLFWFQWSVVLRCNQAVRVANDYIPKMKQYVEVDLNEQWQKTKLIRWAVNVETVVTGTSSNRRAYQKHHIEVTSMLSQNMQNVQMVQVPMQNQQGQHVQQVQQGQVMMLQVAGQQVVSQPVVGQPVTGQQGVQFVVVHQNPNGQTQNVPQSSIQAPPSYEPAGDAPTTVN